MSLRLRPLAFLLLVACSGPAERAAEIAGEMRAEPDRSAQILEEHDMTIEEFEALMYEVASDPELSRRYSEALPPQPGDEGDDTDEGDEADEEADE
jgi:hypothetical protein